MWRSSATRVGERSWFNTPTTFKGLGYEDPPHKEKKIIDYIWTTEPKKDPAADYKARCDGQGTGKLYGL